MQAYERNLKDHPYQIREIKSHNKNKKGEYNKIRFCDDILSFDIETTSAWLQDGKVIPYHKGESAEYWNELEPLALPYIWQFSINDTVYYGREFKDFLRLLKDIPKDLHCIIWIHNLAFEFAFLSGLLEWSSVFARSPHKPMKAVAKKFPNIEFRCTYYLTRLSLDSWGKQIGYHKKSGDLDYDLIRTPLTPLTQTELGYCETDCLVVYHGILDYLKRYKDQWDIPLTQTGTVRREVKERLTSNPDYVRKLKKLVPHSAAEYKVLMDVFAGGYTHANRYLAERPIYAKEMGKLVLHFDFSSSYPTVMVCEKYPMTPWQYTGWKYMPAESTFEKYAYIIQVRFLNMKSTSFNTYLQASKISFEGDIRLDNGRVIEGEDITTLITEQDYLTIKENYQWDKMEVLKVWRSTKDYLPKDFVNYILELYGNKTSLKGVEGMEDLYMQSKQYINSLFGMSVTSIVQADVKLIGDEWVVMPLTEDTVNKKLNSLRWYNPREKRYFLNYSWGVYVTAYARRNLWKCIKSVDHDCIYCDTDSIFVLGDHSFKWYDDEIDMKLKKACDDQGIDFALTRPKTPKGVEKPLGRFTQEDPCTEFITLGAKRYCERREDGKLYLTVSGINKDAVELLGNDISNFRDGFNFDKDAECVHKKLSTYITDQPEVVWPDGYVSKYTHGINLRRTGYDLEMTDEYKNLIKYADMTEDDLPEAFFIQSRGRWRK